MNGLFLGLLTSLLYSFQQFFARKGLEKIDKYLFLIFGNLIMLSVLFSLALTFGFITPSFKIILVILFMGFIGALALLSLYKSFEIGKLAIISPIVNSFPLITIILSLYFFNEKISYLQSVSIILIIAGIFFISFKYEDIKKLKFKFADKGIIFALVTCLGWGVYTFLQKPVVNEVGPVLASFYIESSVLFFSVIIFFNKISSKKKLRFDIIGVKYLFLSAICITLAVLSFNFAITNNAVSLVSALSGLTPIFAFILSYIFLKEKTNFNQKIGIFLSVLGVVLMSI